MRTIVWVWAILVLAACGGGATGSITPTRSATQIETLIIGSGRGDEVSEDFDVPASCPRQVLTYNGEQIDDDVDVAFVNFRVHDMQGDPADSAIGPADLLDTSEGSGRWALDRGTYSIEITSYNATWGYKLQCR